MGAVGRLLERAWELAQLEGALSAAGEGRGQLVVVEAAAGLGKTGLVEVALEAARRGGLSALRARGSELERDFPFGVVRQLLEMRLAGAGEDEREKVFSGAAALARPLFSGAAEGLSQPPDATFGVLYGLYWLLANLAGLGPVVLAVDDAHWADDPSVRFLAFLRPRLEELAVALILAAREAEPGAQRPELAGLLAAPEALALRPGPLSQAAVAKLVGAALERRPDGRFAAACHDATAGNPFYLQLLLRELSALGVEPTAQHASRVGMLAPRTVSRAVLLGLSRLASEAPGLAQALAVLGDGSTVAEVAALAGVEVARAAAGCDLLVRSGFLRGEEGLEFVHPIVREAIYGDMAPYERAAQHGRAARLLAERGSPAERVAAQLLKSEPQGDRWVVEVLRGAAGDALVRGAAETAISLLGRALDEPPPVETRGELLFALGGAESQLGRPDAVGHLREALELAQDPRTRALIARVLGLVLAMSGRLGEGIVLLEQAIAFLPDDERELALELEAELAAVAKMETPKAAIARQRISPLRETVTGQTPAERALLAEIAFQDALEGATADEVAQLAERALVSPRWLLGQYADAPQYFQANHVLVAANRFAEAERHLEEAVSDARAAGSAITLAVASGHLSRLAYHTGRVADAEAQGSAAIELHQATGWTLGQAPSLAFLLDALVERGELERAENALTEYGPGEEIPDGATFNWLLDSRGGLRLAQERWEEAAEDLLEYGRRERDWQARNPAFSAYRSRAALALVALGQREQARRLVEEELRLARGFGAPRAIGIALRAAGLVAGGQEGIGLMGEAVCVLEQSEARLEHARVLVDLGAALRRANRRGEARERLRQGFELARRCGSMRLSERAGLELEAAGARPRQPLMSGLASLTGSERRIAAMAAEGMTNPQIAQALFVSLKTVETHLGNAYRKLGVHSRTELPKVLADES